jgi:hypothetical protein
MPEAKKWVVLTEDKAHRDFLRGALVKKGIPKDIIHQVPCANDAGVLRVYQLWVRWCRQDSSRRLIVCLDGDAKGISGRTAELAARCPASPRESHERFVHLIPVKAIETWIVCLRRSQEVNEMDDYKSAARTASARDAGAAFASSNGESYWCASMKIGRSELSKLLS